MTRADALLGVAAAICGAAFTAVEGSPASTCAGTAAVGGALAFTRSRPVAAWLIALVALPVLARVPPQSFALLLLVAAHVFFTGRWDARWRGSQPGRA